MISSVKILLKILFFLFQSFGRINPFFVKYASAIARKNEMKVSSTLLCDSMY